MARGRVAHLEAELAQLRSVLPQEAFQGRTARSPFAEERHPWRPWRRNGISEGAITESAQPAVVAPRAGYLADIPIGGATQWNQGYTQIGGVADRRTFMEQLQMLYVSCPWSASAVDTIARYCAAGAMDIAPLDESRERLERIVLTAQAQKCQELFRYTNPAQNFRQLIRGVFTDLMVYGDAFIEVVWALGEPIAIYNLPCPTMLIVADEHGIVKEYVQRTPTNRVAHFKPREVIHIKFDSPRGGLYGLGPTEKCVHPIVTWISTEGLLKRTMEKGNPPNIAIAWDQNVPAPRRKTLHQQYLTRNLGPQNVGNPVEVEGDTQVHEFAQNKLAEYLAVKNSCRDEICGAYGTPPAMLAIIESGNLGGGTGTSQFKQFRVNTCGPIEELVLEAFTFSVLQEGFGVTDMRCKFEQLDWRDDAVLENIRTSRVERGIWTINRARDDVGEPPVDGGDDAVIIQTRDVVLVKDLADMSKAQIVKDEGPGGTTTPVLPGVPTVPDTQGQVKPPVGQLKPPSPNDPREAVEAVIAEAWKADVAERRTRALRELTEAH